jgi:L-threonylcarbamoyladenylate synthase
MEEAIAMVLNRDISFQEKEGIIRQAAETIKKGGIVAFPTETVYGLGADAFNPLAVARIFEVKGRPSFDPLIVHVGSPDGLDKLVSEIPPGAKKLIERFWPGPFTVVLSKKEEVPDIVTSGLPTVAVRMPKHPIALSLIEKSECPIAAPSANLFGYLSPTTAEHVQEQLGDQVDLILDGGPCDVGVESTILSFSEKKPTLLRPGGVTLEEIESIIGPVKVLSDPAKVFAPGMLPRHYAPQTPLLLHWSEKDAEGYRDQRIGFLAFKEPNPFLKFIHIEVLSKKGDLREAAANLFSSIRRLDALHLDLILAESVPETGLGRAIMDRLRRASGIASASQDPVKTFRGMGKELYTTEDLLHDRKTERRIEDEQKK